VKVFKSAMKAYSASSLDLSDTNPTGIFLNLYRPRVYDSDGTRIKSQEYSCYQIGEPGKPCPNPPSYDFEPDNITIIQPKATTKSLAVANATCSTATPTINHASARACNTLHITDNGTNEDETSPNPASVLYFDDAVTPKRSELLRQKTYFDSGAAFKLFMPKQLNADDYENVSAAVLEQIDERMRVCLGGINNWWTAVKDGKEDDPASFYEITSISTKCQYVFSALKIARDSMGREGDLWGEGGEKNKK